MAGQPFDYRLQVHNPFEAATQGLVLGSGIRQANEQALALEQKRIADEQAALRQQQVNSRLDALMNNPKPTMRDFVNLSLMLPDKEAKSVRETWDTYNTDQQQNTLNFSGQVLSAFNSKAPDIGIKLLREKAESLKDTDQEQAKAYSAYADIAEINPDGAMKNIATMVAVIPGGDKVLTGIFGAGKEEREQNLAPTELKEKKSAAELKAAEAKNAPLKLAAELKLTKAQTAKVMAEGRKLGVETQKVLMELESLKKTGGVDPAKRFEQEEKLRKEYTSRSGAYNEMRRSNNIIAASAKDKSGAGDLGLIFAFMKMLDPGSVVRESEFALARDTGGLYSRLQGMASKVQSGEFLPPKEREAYARLANEYMAAANKEQSITKKSLERVVSSYGLSAENVFASDAPPVAPPKPPTPAPAEKGFRVIRGN